MILCYFTTDLIMVKNLTAEGMENWGAVLYKEGNIACHLCEETTHKAGQQRKGKSLRLLAHELVHQVGGMVP